MRLLESEGLVVDVANLGDRDRVVTLITPEHGKVRGAAKGARTKYSRYAGQVHLLAKVRFGWFEKDTSQLARLREVQLLRPADGLQQELEGILVGAYMAEHVSVFAQENEESRRLFRLLDSTLEALLAGRVGTSLAARYFEAWILRLAGIFPEPTECPECGAELRDLAVAVEGGMGLVCGDCAAGASGLRVGPQVVSFLRRISRERVEGLAERPPTDGVLERVEEVCRHVRREFLGDELRSYQVMRRTLGEVGHVPAGGSSGPGA